MASPDGSRLSGGASDLARIGSALSFVEKLSAPRIALQILRALAPKISLQSIRSLHHKVLDRQHQPRYPVPMFDPRPHRIRRFHRSAENPTRPSRTAPEVFEALRFIRDTMERSAAFTAVSGWGQVLLGATAIATAYLAALQPSPFAWLRVWLAESLLAVAIGLFSCTWKANRRGLPL